MLHVEVRVKGAIEDAWSDWFFGLGIADIPPDESTLSGDLPDQAAFLGLLAKLRDLGFRLVLVRADERTK